jgi:hypothetical protein
MLDRKGSRKYKIKGFTPTAQSHGFNPDLLWPGLWSGLPAIGYAFRRGGRASSLGCRGIQKAYPLYIFCWQIVLEPMPPFTQRQSESATLLVLGFLQAFKNLTCELSRLMLMIPKILFLPICKVYVLNARVHVRRFRFLLIGMFQVIYN